MHLPITRVSVERSAHAWADVHGLALPLRRKLRFGVAANRPERRYLVFVDRNKRYIVTINRGETS
jgi:hypothetical protein